MFVINVVLTVRQPEAVDAVRVALRKAGQMSRLEPGCLQFEVCQDENNPQVFILCERWENKTAWETHRQAEAFTTIYQPTVLPLVERQPYFCQILD